jgi:hypothetical protein
MSERVYIERRLQISGVLVILGLLVELISLYWSHPTAFLSFIALGGVMIGAGMSYYLYSLITNEKSIRKEKEGQSPALISNESGSAG